MNGREDSHTYKYTRIQTHTQAKLVEKKLQNRVINHKLRVNNFPKNFVSAYF